METYYWIVDAQTGTILSTIFTNREDAESVLNKANMPGWEAQYEIVSETDTLANIFARNPEL